MFEDEFISNLSNIVNVGIYKTSQPHLPLMYVSLTTNTLGTCSVLILLYDTNVTVFESVRISME